MCASRKTTFPGRRPLFYYITDQKRLSGTTLSALIRRAARWGVDFVQIREKDLCDRDLYELSRKAVGAVRETNCRVLVNGRADIALAAGAHGVHFPSTGLRVRDIRPWLPRGFLVGVSAHSAREVARAAASGADYVLLGPVFATESKERFGPPLGLDYLRRVCHSVRIPVFGLGGIQLERVSSVLIAGAVGVAGISLFQNAPFFERLGPIRFAEFERR